jgi:hypothetical protein
MYTEGTNGTHFKRTLEDISTRLAETATLKIYDLTTTKADNSVIEGSATAAKNVRADASLLAGTFQLIYDGELSPVMPVTSSANQVMQYLSEMSSFTHVPAVKKTSGGTEDPDNTLEAVTVGSDYVSWIFTFDKRFGDAKKLTFKYTDALGDEQVTSNIIGSGGMNLKNEPKSLDHASSSRPTRYVSNKIVMLYESGSIFYDAIDDDYDGANAAVDVQTKDNKFQDELAMDVVPGTTFSVSSSEVHHMYMYQTDNEFANGANNLGVDTGCLEEDATSSKYNPHFVVEYNGDFTQPVPLCGATAGRFATDANMKTVIAGISALADISITIGSDVAPAGSPAGSSIDANIGTEFGERFTWAETHSGKAKVRVSITLPMGTDGDSFKIHFQRGAAKDAATARFATTKINQEFKIFTHRERNNNGRTFTVTKAYENKVSDLLSVSRITAYEATTDGTVLAGGGLAGVIPNTDWQTGCGTRVRSSMTPGTYYNVIARLDTTWSADADATAAGAGARLMVVVGGDGKIKEVQITAGGTSKYVAGKKKYTLLTRAWEPWILRTQLTDAR